MKTVISIQTYNSLVRRYDLDEMVQYFERLNIGRARVENYNFVFDNYLKSLVVIDDYDRSIEERKDRIIAEVMKRFTDYEAIAIVSNKKIDIMIEHEKNYNASLHKKKLQWSLSCKLLDTIYTHPDYKHLPHSDTIYSLVHNFEPSEIVEDYRMIEIN